MVFLGDDFKILLQLLRLLRLELNLVKQLLFLILQAHDFLLEDLALIFLNLVQIDLLQLALQLLFLIFEQGNFVDQVLYFYCLLAKLCLKVILCPFDALLTLLLAH